MAANYRVNRPNSLAAVTAMGTVTSIRPSTNGQAVKNVSVVFNRSWPCVDAEKKPVMENGKQKFEQVGSFIEFALWNRASEINVALGDLVEVAYSLADLKADPYMKEGAAAASLKCTRAQMHVIAAKQGEGTEAPALVAAPDPEAEFEL